MTTILTEIKALIGISNPSSPLVNEAFSVLNKIENAYLICVDGIITDFGPMAECPYTKYENVPHTLIQCTGKMVMPTYCDSHTHLVFAASREEEFVDRINGLTYEEIAKKGGGILNSARKLQVLSEDELYHRAAKRLTQLILLGTGAIEIKSGYGLSVDGELKMLRVIKKLKENFPIPIKATFLGAHALPVEYKENREGYLNLLVNELFPAIADEGLADFVDVFCELNYFTPEETNMICKVGKQFGLFPKLHVNQFNSIGGIQVAVENNAISVDHLEVMKEHDFDLLANSKTIATALPSCSFFLGIPYAPAKEFIKRNIPFAMASDFNPGSTPSGNMNFVVSLGCIQLKLTPEQSINACTINGAFAMRLQQKTGSIAVGKLANVIITKEIESYNYLPYSFGENLIDQVLINGRPFKG